MTVHQGNSANDLQNFSFKPFFSSDKHAAEKTRIGQKSISILGPGQVLINHVKVVVSLKVVNLTYKDSNCETMQVTLPNAGDNVLSNIVSMSKNIGLWLNIEQ